MITLMILGVIAMIIIMYYAFIGVLYSMMRRVQIVIRIVEACKNAKQVNNDNQEETK